jgi:hypothetical protein
MEVLIMGLFTKSMGLFSQMADKFAPSSAPLEALVKEKKKSKELYKEMMKIIVMMGGGAFTGSALAIVGFVLLVLLVPFLLFQILFFPIAAPLTIAVLSLVIGIISEMD